MRPGNWPRKLQRTPTEAEIAEKLGIDVDRWRQMMLDLRTAGLVSASTRANENDDLPAPDFPSDPDTQPDAMCAKEQLRSVLETAMKSLPERYKKVVVLYYTNEMTMKEIGGVLGINESRVSQIHKSALEKMNVALQGAGIHSSFAFLGQSVSSVFALHRAAVVSAAHSFLRPGTDYAPPFADSYQVTRLDSPKPVNVSPSRAIMTASTAAIAAPGPQPVIERPEHLAQLGFEHRIRLRS